MRKDYWTYAMEARHGRKLFDKIVIWIFRGVFFRWMNAHVWAAYKWQAIYGSTASLLDAQAKSDLGLSGFRKPTWDSDKVDFNGNA